MSSNASFLVDVMYLQELYLKKSNNLRETNIIHLSITIISCVYVINNKMWEIYVLNYIIQGPHKQLGCSP